MKRKHKDAMIAMGIKIAAIEQLQRNHGEAHRAIGVLPQFTNLFKRVEEIEKRMVQIDIHRDRLADHDECIEALWEKGTENDSGMLSMLKVIPDIEILKTQVAGLEEKPSSKRLMDIETEIKDMREDYHAHFRGLRGDEIKTLIDRTEVLVRDVDALQIRLSRAQDMIAEMQRDSRILKSPGYKKEIAAQKQDAKSKKAK